jgi:poly-gamma-glutamate capsule biosynthesis protein CapA/YwtB (metallophosphatase superfamily)
VLLAAVLLVAGGVLAWATLLRDGGAAALEESSGRIPSRPAPPSPSVPSPVPSPDASPSPTLAARGRLVIHGTGDVNLDPGYIPNFQRFGYDHAWSGLDGLFERDDLTVVNLECAVSNLGSKVPKQFNFRGDPAALRSMREAGVEVANLGNNHAFDYGPEALVDTIRNLRSNGIAPVGAGRDERRATDPAVFEMKGWRVAVVGIGNVVEPEPAAVAGPGKPGVACNDDIACMERAVKKARRAADLVVVSIHWGVELHPEPNAFQAQIAHALIDAGADVIFGHHSHRLGSTGEYRGRPIFWSLGNFVWPNFSEAGSTTAVAEVVVTAKGKLRARLIPAFIESAGHPVLRGS